MKRMLFLLMAATVLAGTAGCANGPLRRFCRGAPCSTCNPPLGQNFGGGWGGTASNCESGVCPAPDGNAPPIAGNTNSSDAYSTAKYPTDGYPYPGTSSAPAQGNSASLTPLDAPVSDPWANSGAIGTGAGGALNGYVNPPSIGPLPGPGR
jgi:hypothetical protein